MLRSVVTRLARSASLLDLYPVLPMLRLAGGGKSYHWGGSFPHSSDRSTSAGVTDSGALGLGSAFTLSTRRSSRRPGDDLHPHDHGKCPPDRIRDSRARA